MERIRFGIIGCGLMGRLFASEVARYCSFIDSPGKPEVTAICNRTLSEYRIGWFKQNFPSITQITDDYMELLNNDNVDAVYAAVPHNMHEEIYNAAIKAGKHLLGEKPFGIDLDANESIIKTLEANSSVRAGVASQYVFWPGAQRMLKMVEDDFFGEIIEIDSGFFHCSDLNPDKPINWKRLIEVNGEYGSLGDLGVHIAMVGFRAGFEAFDCRAVCQNLVPVRPDGKGGSAKCETVDNVTILSRCNHMPTASKNIPWTLKVHRIMPGEMNTWYIGIYGKKGCARFSLKYPRTLEVLEYKGGAQNWQHIDIGSETAYPTIVGGIFEFGASDAFGQLIASFVYETVKGESKNRIAACPSPMEMNKCHKLFSAALQSGRSNSTIEL